MPRGAARRRGCLGPYLLSKAMMHEHPLSIAHGHSSQSICAPDDRMSAQRTITDSVCRGPQQTCIFLRPLCGGFCRTVRRASAPRVAVSKDMNEVSCGRNDRASLWRIWRSTHAEVDLVALEGEHGNKGETSTARSRKLVVVVVKLDIESRTASNGHT